MAIKMFSYVGEKVLDPFAGSFTSPKVAAQLNRIGVGIELNKKEFGKAIIKNIDLDNDDFFKNKIKYDEFDLTKEEKLNKQI
jgi:DNA modification methylase